MIRARTHDTMPLAEKPYKYDVFISYSSADRTWAEKLFRALERRDIEPFLDQTRLQTGAAWESQLQGALRTSRHIVVLWSENARQSDWVRRELGRFESQIDNPDPDQKPSNRRMIFLPLEGEPSAYNSLQMITDLRDGGAYTGPADQVDQNLWSRVLDKVYYAIAGADPAIPVSLAVLTVTQEQLDQLDPAHKPRFVEKSLDGYLSSIGIGAKDDLRPYYGQERTDWRPFGSDQTVWTMLTQLRQDINVALRDAGLEGTQFRWEPVGEEFWSDDYEAFVKETRKLKSDWLSVVVVDPIALYDEDVRDRFSRLSNELKNSRVLFMTLLPLQCWETHRQVREQIKRMAHPVFTHLYEPTLGQDVAQAFWSCDVNIGDKMDIQRTLLPALGRRLVGKPVSEFLRHRSAGS